MAGTCDTFASYPSTRYLSATLQKLPTQYHWVLANEALLSAISRGEPVAWGIRGRRLRGLVNVSQKLGFLWPLLWLVGAVELSKLLIQQCKSTRNGIRRTADYPARFFVGFGAGPEELILKIYSESHPGNVGRLDVFNAGSFADWHRVRFMPGLRALAHALAAARMAVAALPPELAHWHSNFLTSAGMRAGHFAYMHAWFEILKTKAYSHLEEIVFLAGDTAAFAAADVDLPICYLQHGFIQYSILPEFTRIEVLTTDEAAFMKEALPQAHISLRPQQSHALVPTQLTREILVTSIYGDSNCMSRIAPVIAWASAMKIPIRVRPHPCEIGAFWSGYEANGIVSIEKGDAGIIQAINRLRPRLVVSWFSTTLAEALELGIVPVTVCADDDRDVKDTVYPIFQRCLRWPQDSGIVMRLLDDDELYASVLSRLRRELSEV